MATSNIPNRVPAGGPRPAPDAQLGRIGRFEIADEEQRALVGSWATSITLGIVWLVLVYLGPHGKPLTLLPAEDPPIEITFPNEESVAPPTPTAGTEVPAPGPANVERGPRNPQRGNPRQGASGSRTEENRIGAIGDAFGSASGAGSGGMVGDVSNVLRGVDVNTGSGGTGGGLNGAGGGGAGGKTVLGYGQGGQGSATPGRGGIGGGLGTGGGGGGGIGGVGGGGGVARSTIRISAPRPIDVPNVARARGNTEELGTFVRRHEAELRFCYNEYGLKVNPGLAGSVNTSVTLTEGGSVTGVDVASRSWGGAGASEAESCIRRKIQSWRFPAGNEGTYGFSFNFTR